MAENTVKHYGFYRKGKRFATATGSEYTGESNDESLNADGKYFGHSDGPMATKFTLDTIEPVRKTDSAGIARDMIAKRPFEVAAGLIAGEVHTVKVRCVRYVFTSDMNAGKLTGKFDFEGGEPTISG